MKKATPFRPNVLRHGVLAMGLAVALTAAAAAAEPYTLNVSDKINVRVVQWKAAESTFEEWTALGGEYIVGPSGTTAFPFVGDVESAGKTSRDLARELADGLKQSLGLVVSPNVSIEIAEFAPIYVAGDVQSLGEYKFLPGLTLIKALSSAGGETAWPRCQCPPRARHAYCYWRLSGDAGRAIAAAGQAGPDRCRIGREGHGCVARAVCRCRGRRAAAS
ncbi:polysaccharide export protein [Devosia sp. A8/3-2]|nr:polysaccharide export protein [Devosia sp. A8/3-2]